MHSTGSVIDCIQETVVLMVLVRKGENKHRVTYHLKFNFKCIMGTYLNVKIASP